eukprot:m.92622 g.92622  ORF g.92622 m.92622 type:complete len:743 (+) comp36748_c1_seq1:518-2746(+)
MPLTGELNRIAQLLMKCSKDGMRPMLFVSQLWHPASDYLVEAACHPLRRVAKASVMSLHSTISSILTHRVEKVSFSTQELLFRPLENLIALQMCDADTQHQVVSSLCELVEQSMGQILSGWQSVFRTLRAVRSYGTEAVANVVLEIIAAVLRSGDAAIFAAAAVPCIQCLVKLVMDDAEISLPPSSPSPHPGMVNPENRLTVILNCLSRFARCLAVVYAMRPRPSMRGAERIRLPVRDGDGWSDDSGILTVWGLLLSGIMEAIVQCRRAVNPAIVKNLQEILLATLKSSGRKMYVMAVVDVVLLAIETWVSTARWDGDSLANFALVYGSMVDLVVESFLALDESSDVGASRHRVSEGVLQLVAVCLKQEEEKVARLGCSTLRHFVSSCGVYFDGEIWSSVSSRLIQGLSATLSPMATLISKFVAGDDGVLGQSEDLQVVARKDTSVGIARRTLELAEQVLVFQGSSSDQSSSEIDKKLRHLEQQTSQAVSRSLSFVWPVNESSDTFRLPFRQVVVSLIAHQLLLQYTGEVLLSESTLFISHLSPEALSLLTDVLLQSVSSAIDLESRPGLTLLMEKTLSLDLHPVSLGKQALTSLNLYLNSLLYVANSRGRENDTVVWLVSRVEKACQLVVGHLTAIVPPAFAGDFQKLARGNAGKKSKTSADRKFEEIESAVLLWEECVHLIVDAVTELPQQAFQATLSVAYEQFVKLVSAIQSKPLRKCIEKFLMRVGTVFKMISTGKEN